LGAFITMNGNFNGMTSGNDFSRVNAVAAAAPNLGIGRPQDIDRSRDVLVASASNVVVVPGVLRTVTVHANDDWGLGPAFDEISSLIDGLGSKANTAWQAYTGAADGAQSVIKDAVVGSASWINDSLWQAGNIVSGGTLAKMTSQVEQAGYRQSQRSEALLGGLKSLSINAGLTVVDLPGQATRAWNAVSAEADHIRAMYQSGDVHGAFALGSRDATTAVALIAPVVGPTTRLVGGMAETGLAGTRLALEDFGASATGQLVNEKLVNLQARNGALAYASPPGPSLMEGVTSEIGNASSTLTNISRSDLGDLLGQGGNKDVFAYGDNQAVGVLRSGTNPRVISEEISMLQKLKESGLPTVNPSEVTVDGAPGMLMNRFDAGSKSIVKLLDGKIRIVGESPLLNKQSVSDLQAIRDTMVNGKIQINDLQFLIGNQGRVVVADPLAVNFGTKPSANNLRMIDLLLQSARKNGPF
jgi:hypothetical protein